MNRGDSRDFHMNRIDVWPRVGMTGFGENN
jgi:hypothetical protein